MYHFSLGLDGLCPHVWQHGSREPKHNESLQAPFRNVTLRPDRALASSRSFSISFFIKVTSSIVPAKVTVTLELPHQTKEHKGHRSTDSFLMHLCHHLPLCLTHLVLSVYHVVHISLYFNQYIPTGVMLQYAEFSQNSPVQKMRGRSGTGITQTHTLSTHKCTKGVGADFLTLQLELFIFNGRSQPRHINSFLCCGIQRTLHKQQDT